VRSTKQALFYNLLITLSYAYAHSAHSTPSGGPPDFVMLFSLQQSPSSPQKRKQVFVLNHITTIFSIVVLDLSIDYSFLKP